MFYKISKINEEASSLIQVKLWLMLIKFQELNIRSAWSAGVVTEPSGVMEAFMTQMSLKFIFKAVRLL